ncbi:MAG: hypothetical protein WAW17_21645 [Rhodococcus sp. (in: high G+C Gram-positive bacteria)]|uniref:hypothetical protein n=1 Tax=Rhodococcus sp. TaxID=1831 RepID=UPI003BAE6C99
MPGPIIAEHGDVFVLSQPRSDRIAHDLAHPFWTSAQHRLFRCGKSAGFNPPFESRVPPAGSQLVRESTAASPTNATVFRKSASAMLVGDYLRVHGGRYPLQDRTFDEGFSRIEAIRIVDAADALVIFADTAWHGDVVTISVYGLRGTLLLRAQDEVDVLAFVNPERAALDVRDPWATGPMLGLSASRRRTADEMELARKVDHAHRPEVDESAFYSSMYKNPDERRRAVESKIGLRMVPLSALPWPHRQYQCAFAIAAGKQLGRYGDAQAAHAAGFLSPDGQDTMKSCRYHEPRWLLVSKIVADCWDQRTQTLPGVADHPLYADLPTDDREALSSLTTDPMVWNDGADAIANGQHRLCAMRAAGVTHSIVDGQFLPDTDYGRGTSAVEHARATLDDRRRTQIRVMNTEQIQRAHAEATRNGHTLTDSQAREFALILEADLEASERMEELFLAGLLSPETLAAAASKAWKGKPYDNDVRDEVWREMFRIAGFTKDNRRARRPLLPVTLYRGAGVENREGLSWTTLPGVAHYFAQNRQRVPFTGMVWTARVPAKRILARPATLMRVSTSSTLLV